MADSSASEDSETPSRTPEPFERLQKRNELLFQENKVLKFEIDTCKLRIKGLVEENRALRQASVHIQARAEQEEEYISNTLLKQIQTLKKEKENLALNYEQEEECLTNDLSRKLNQLRQEKVQLEHTLEQEQECLVNKLMRRIEKLENETTAKQSNLETLRREKIELENTLEQEQEALVNKLWKRMDRLETEKRSLQVKLDQPVSEPPSPRIVSEINNGDTAATLANNIHALRQECARLKQQLTVGKQEHERKMAEYAKEEKEVKDENLRLQRRLQVEVERREALCRHLSESESSLEMEEERIYNELAHNHSLPHIGNFSLTSPLSHRSRTLSSPVPGTIIMPSSPASSSRPLSPGLNYGDSSRNTRGCSESGPTSMFSPPTSMSRIHHPHMTTRGVLSPSPPPSSLLMTTSTNTGIRRLPVCDRFAKPNLPSIPSMSPISKESDDSKPPSSPMDTADPKI